MTRNLFLAALCVLLMASVASAQGSGLDHTYGPGDGSGTGVGPAYGTGFGPGSGTDDCNGDGGVNGKRSDRRKTG